MAKSDMLLDDLVNRIRALPPGRQNAGFAIEAGPRRPIWKQDEISISLYEQARAIAFDLGFDLSNTVSGGGSDGNFTGSLGIATLDGLGARGNSLHTDQEHIVVSSLSERGRLFAGLLATLS
jgi:glutamate carboxypeptidase